MKPHIKKKKGHSAWVCTRRRDDPAYRPYEMVGVGHTPAGAYRNWLDLTTALYT